MQLFLFLVCHEDVLFGVWCLFWLSDPENNKVSAPGGFSILEYSPNIYEGSANTNVYKCMIYVVYHSWISYVYKIWFSVCIQDIYSYCLVFIRVHEIFIFCKDGDDPKLFPSFAVTSQASQQQSRQKTCNQNVSKAHGEALGWRRIFLFRLQNLVGMFSQG